MSAPFAGARLAEVGTECDGDRDLCTVESDAERVAEVGISSFPGVVPYVVGLPGRRWLGSAARADWTEDGTQADTAWIIDDAGHITASGCRGDAHRRPVVTSDGRIFVAYFDEHPSRGSDGAWSRDANGDWTLAPGSI
jgi:hypothetical protein